MNVEFSAVEAVELLFKGDVRWPQGGTESVRRMREHATRGCGREGAALSCADGGHPCVPGEGAGGWFIVLMLSADTQTLSEHSNRGSAQ